MALRNRDQANVEPDVAEQPASPWTRPGFVASAVLVLAIVVAGIVLSTTPGGSKAPRAAAPTEAPSTTTTSHVAVADSDSVCGLPNGDQTVPVSPPQTTWTLIGSVAAPSATNFGPGRLTNDIRTCFAHNPVGALFFAATAGAEGTDTRISAVALDEALLADGPGKTKAIDADAASPSAAPNADAGTNLFQVAGFRFLDYSSERATLELVIRLTSGPDAGTLTAVPETVIWTDGDWRAYVPDSGVSPDGTPITSLAGYTAWSGA